MTDVFVSYARPDEPHAARVADALRAQGFQAWRDDELPAHRAYAEVIEERLASAAAVVVLWSSEAAKSQWVRAEADAARNSGTLVQARLDACVPPIPFSQIQCADLSGWNGDLNAAGWRRLVASIEALTGQAAPPEQKPRAGRRQQVSVCVLPFANMSGEAEQEYFSDGISEDITTDLSKVSALAVTARNTAFTFKGQSVDVCDIASRLGVTHLLEGSVRKAGNRLRITAQLIDGATGDHVWAERYDRDLTDIFAIQDEISQAIVQALKIKLLPEEKKAIRDRGTTDVDAYNLYLMARQYWVTGDFGNQRREETTIRLCKRAVEIDPSYAQAWALLGLAQANLCHGFSSAHVLDDGAAAANRALALDPDIAEAHLPIAWCLAEQGRHDEANAKIAIALRLGPESWEVHKEAARLFYRQRRLPEAAAHLDKATQLMEADYHGLGMLFAYYFSEGDMEGARLTAEKVVNQVEKILVEHPENGAALAFGAPSLAVLGQRDRARQWIDQALLLDSDNLQMRYNLAWGLNKVFGDTQAALDMLEPVLANAGSNIVRLAANDPNLDNLRTEPRFIAMIEAAEKRVGLSKATVSPPAASATPLRS